MARMLTVGVAVRHPDSGAVQFLPSGSDLPGWAAGLVGDHALTAESQPEAAPSDDWKAGHANRLKGSPPPQAGPGASRARWLGYARQNNVDVVADTSREDIIAACEIAGVPVK